MRVQLKAIFFDLDGTLADDSDPIKDALSQACVVVCSCWPELNPAEVAVIYRQVSDAVWGDFDLTDLDPTPDFEIPGLESRTECLKQISNE